MNSSTTSKDELLVENAILKYNERVQKMLREELKPLSAHIGTVEERVNSIDDRLKEVEQVMEPFSIIRKRFWFVLIAGALMVSIAGSKISTYIEKII